MKRNDLIEKVKALKEETRVALQTVFDELNQGQQKKILKNEEIVKLFDRYGVNYTE